MYNKKLLISFAKTYLLKLFYLTKLFAMKNVVKLIANVVN